MDQTTLHDHPVRYAAMTLQPHPTLLYHTLTAIGCAIGLISHKYDVLINANNVFYDGYRLECEFDSVSLLNTTNTTNTTNTFGDSSATRIMPASTAYREVTLDQYFTKVTGGIVKGVDVFQKEKVRLKQQLKFTMNEEMSQLEFCNLINANNVFRYGFGCDESTSPATSISGLILSKHGFENENASFFECEFDDLKNKIIDFNSCHFFGGPHCPTLRRANTPIITFSSNPAVFNFNDIGVVILRNNVLKHEYSIAGNEYEMFNGMPFVVFSQKFCHHSFYVSELEIPQIIPARTLAACFFLKFALEVVAVAVEREEAIPTRGIYFLLSYF